ncbi:Cdc6/Cdc18 family protein [Natronomonas sp. LN261]|uniref:Cdc6/Cdc18 family protein n=1 Tax=Natronomonas sp. LN261 TaxID=2750669 RepID=UPI0015EE3DAA|nr:AAA family ATPase [Natronomonas sp. LN261]
MILDRRALDPDALPDRLIERNDELNAISSAIDPQVGAPRPVFLFGPSGSGKTTVATFALEEARSELFDVSTAFLSCRDQTRAAVLRATVREAIGGHKVYQSKGADALRRELEMLSDRLLVICDEADQLREKQVLADLYGIDGCTLIIIGNREAELFAELEAIAGGRSRFSCRETIEFQKYEHGTLRRILEARVEQGLQRGSVTSAALDAIAKHADGDARQAVATLQRCVRTVVDGRERVTVDVVEAVAPDAVAALRQQKLEALSEDLRTLYAIVADAETEAEAEAGRGDAGPESVGATVADGDADTEAEGAGKTEAGGVDPADGTGEGEAVGLRPGEIYERYADAVANPVTQRTVTTYLGKLVEYDLLLAEGRTRARRYRTVEGK